MVIGYVMVETALEKAQSIFNTLKAYVKDKKSDIIEVHPLFGEYDLIVKINTEDFRDVGEIVVEDIRSLEGVTNTKTITGIKF